MTTHYLGYPTHTDWLAAIDKSQPVNALSIVHTECLGVGLHKNRHMVVLSQANGDEVHVLRLVTDVFQTMDGHDPLDGKLAVHEKRAETAWSIIQTWLGEQNLVTRRALLAIPKDIQILEGHADGLMKFDKDLGWFFADRIDPAFLEPYVPATAQGARHV